MDPTFGVALLALVGTIVTAVITYRASAKATRVNESAEQRQWVVEARNEARSARGEIAEARREIAETRREAELLGAKLHDLIMAIHDPGITLPRLRAMVPVGGGLNGSTYPGEVR